MRGKLLRGSLGGRLQALPDVAAGVVSCVAWSADGQLLALASASCITVQHVESGRHFRTEFNSKVMVLHCVHLKAQLTYVCQASYCVSAWFRSRAGINYLCRRAHTVQSDKMFACHVVGRRPRMPMAV